MMIIFFLFAGIFHKSGIFCFHKVCELLHYCVSTGGGNFNRGWDEYTNGFENPNRGGFCGLNILKEKYDLYSHVGGFDFLNIFSVNLTSGNSDSLSQACAIGVEVGERPGFQLNVTSYRGISATHPGEEAFLRLNGQNFTHYSRDSDNWSSGNCAKFDDSVFNNGWWYSNQPGECIEDVCINTYQGNPAKGIPDTCGYCGSETILHWETWYCYQHACDDAECDYCNITDTKECLVCRSGYYLLENGACEPFCNWDSFKDNRGIPKCTRCDDVITGCLRCSNHTTCSECQAEMFLLRHSDTMDECLTNEECDLKPGYYLKNNRTCERCGVEHCETCQQEGRCDVCSPPRKFVLKVGEEQPDSCLSLEQCDELPSHIPLDNECVRCESLGFMNCERCSLDEDEGECLECAAGHPFLKRNSTQCVDTHTCEMEGLNPLTTLDGDISRCLACSDLGMVNCFKCVDNQTCYECEDSHPLRLSDNPLVCLSKGQCKSQGGHVTKGECEIKRKYANPEETDDSTPTGVIVGVVSGSVLVTIFVIILAFAVFLYVKIRPNTRGGVNQLAQDVEMEAIPHQPQGQDEEERLIQDDLQAALLQREDDDLHDEPENVVADIDIEMPPAAAQLQREDDLRDEPENNVAEMPPAPIIDDEDRRELVVGNEVENNVIAALKKKRGRKYSSGKLSMKKLRDRVKEGGSEFKKYKLYDRIGCSVRRGFYGSQCLVVACKMRKSNEMLAMKIFSNIEEGPNEHLSTLVEIEVKKLMEIDFHPNLVCPLHYFKDTIDFTSSELIKDVFESPDNVPNQLRGKTLETFVIIFKYYPSNLKETIRNHRNNGEKFAKEDFLKIMEQILLGLCHLQDNKIVHADLKPDNILCDQQSLTCSICDFGCNMDFSDTEGFKYKFNSNQQIRIFQRGCGAPEYRAPEIYVNSESENKCLDYEKNDVFALGLIAYEMMSLSEEYNPAFPECGVDSRVQEEYRELSEFGISSEISEFVGNLLKVDPSKRLSCEEALQKVIELKLGIIP